MDKYIVVGPVDGLFHVAYKITWTKTYHSVTQFTSETEAHQVAERINDKEKSESDVTKRICA